MTADPAGQELNIGERVDYTRAHLPTTQRERYEQELREATERALATGAYGPLGDVAELYQILAVTPLPGQSDLEVQPHPVEFRDDQGVAVRGVQGSARG